MGTSSRKRRNRKPGGVARPPVEKASKVLLDFMQPYLKHAPTEKILKHKMGTS